MARGKAIAAAKPPVDETIPPAGETAPAGGETIPAAPDRLAGALAAVLAALEGVCGALDGAPGVNSLRVSTARRYVDNARVVLDGLGVKVPTRPAP